MAFWGIWRIRIDFFWFVLTLNGCITEFYRCKRYFWDIFLCEICKISPKSHSREHLSTHCSGTTEGIFDIFYVFLKRMLVGLSSIIVWCGCILTARAKIRQKSKFEILASTVKQQFFFYFQGIFFTISVGYGAISWENSRK